MTITITLLALTMTISACMGVYDFMQNKMAKTVAKREIKEANKIIDEAIHKIVGLRVSLVCDPNEEIKAKYLHKLIDELKKAKKEI